VTNRQSPTLLIFQKSRPFYSLNKKILKIKKKVIFTSDQLRSCPEGIAGRIFEKSVSTLRQQTIHHLDK
jgi:hypothetical protein